MYVQLRVPYSLFCGFYQNHENFDNNGYHYFVRGCTNLGSYLKNKLYADELNIVVDAINNSTRENLFFEEKILEQIRDSCEKIFSYLQ